MADINPPARTRIRPVVTAEPKPVGPIEARPRIRARPLLVDPEQKIEVAPRARVRTPVDPGSTNPWYIPPGARPLGVMQKTHNGANPSTGELPDPRFRPLLIVLDQYRRKHFTPYVEARFTEMLKLKPEDVAKLEAMVVTNDYICEFGLRYIGYRSISDEVYEAMRARIFALWDVTDPKTKLFDGTKSMMTRTEDGDLLVDFNKNAGPFYAEGVLSIEFHARNKLVALQRGA